MKCSIAFGSISFQRPALFSLTLLSSSTIHKQMTRKRINFAFDPRLLLCKSCSCLRDSRENFWLDLPSETTAPSYSKLVTKPTFCPFALMPLVLFVISLFCSASSTLCRFCRKFQLGLLVLALSQLEHLYYRQTIDF